MSKTLKPYDVTLTVRLPVAATSKKEAERIADQNGLEEIQNVGFASASAIELFDLPDIYQHQVLCYNDEGEEIFIKDLCLKNRARREKRGEA